MQHTFLFFLFICILFSLLRFLDTKGQLFQGRQLNKSGILSIFSVPVSRSLQPRKASSSHLTLFPFQDNQSVCHFIFVALNVVKFTVLCLVAFLVGCFYFFFLRAVCLFCLNFFPQDNNHFTTAEFQICLSGLRRNI